MRKKTHTLDERENYEFGLIGISSPENDYRMSWILNNVLGFKFIRQDDLELYHKKLEGQQAFHQFRYYDEDTMLQYRMISNKCENGYLLEEMMNIDFVIQVTGDFNEGFTNKLAGSINSISEVSLAFPIDPSSLRSRKRLLL